MNVTHAVFREHAKSVKAALTNEQITRARIEAVENWLRAWTARGFLGRMKWLLWGL